VVFRWRLFFSPFFSLPEKVHACPLSLDFSISVPMFLIAYFLPWSFL
jgi:hypothetical protein